jgi:hypothetical protein
MCNEKLLNDKIQILEYKIDRIEKKLDQITSICNKMDNHINFVDGVYSVVKNPFHRVMSYVDGYRLINNQDSNNSNSALNNV